MFNTCTSHTNAYCQSAWMHVKYTDPGPDHHMRVITRVCEYNAYFVPTFVKSTYTRLRLKQSQCTGSLNSMHAEMYGHQHTNFICFIKWSHSVESQFNQLSGTG